MACWEPIAQGGWSAFGVTGETGRRDTGAVSRAQAEKATHRPSTPQTPMPWPPCAGPESWQAEGVLQPQLSAPTLLAAVWKCPSQSLLSCYLLPCRPISILPVIKPSLQRHSQAQP